MIKKVLCAVMMLSLIGTIGCSALSKTETTTTTTPSSVRLVREAQIASQWTVKQLEINLETEIPIMLTLNNGDKAEGYFYVSKGNGVKFKISGSSQIYESKPETGKEVTSDKFSFTASQSQGSGYTLLLSTIDETDKQKTDTVVFLELIYPAEGSLFVPFGTK
jgi:acid phosphatase class B